MQSQCILQNGPGGIFASLQFRTPDTSVKSFTISLAACRQQALPTDSSALTIPEAFPHMMLHIRFCMFLSQGFLAKAEGVTACVD